MQDAGPAEENNIERLVSKIKTKIPQNYCSLKIKKIKD